MMLEHRMQPSPARTIRQYMSCSTTLWAGLGKGHPQARDPAIPNSHAVCPHSCLQSACRQASKPAGMRCVRLCLAPTQIVATEAGWSLQDAGDAISRACWSLHHGELLYWVWRDGSQTVGKPSVETSLTAPLMCQVRNLLCVTVSWSNWEHSSESAAGTSVLI